MRRAALGAVVAGLAVATVGPAGAAATGSSPASDAVLVYDVRSTVGGDPGKLAERLVAAGYDVVGRDGATISVLGQAELASRLSAERGVAVVDQAPYPVAGPAAAPSDQDDILPRRLDGKTYPTFYGGYRTVDAYLDFTTDLAAAYPKLVRSVDYGTSWTGDHPLRAVCVTADARSGCGLDPDTDTPRFLVVAQTHARELTTSDVMWRYLTYLVDGYGRKAQVTSVLDSTEIWIVPQTNPDGIETVEQGITDDGFGGDSRAWQRKNLDDRYSDPACTGQWSSSQEGVDLNRNFPIDWGRTGTSTQPCNLTYGGPKAASEPETTAQTDLMQALFRDQRGGGDAPAPLTTTGAMLTLHSYANQVLLPWGFTTEHAPNNTGLRSFGFRMSYFNGYETGQSGEILYNSSGATEDWLYDRLGVPGFTWEIGPDSGTCSGFFPAYSCQAGFFAQNRDALMYAAAAARQPYTQTLGPTTVSVKATPKADAIAMVKATADDDAYGDEGIGRPRPQAVTEGRLYLGDFPSEGSEPFQMAVVGSGSRVKLQLGITQGAEPLMAYVQARDADGNWGPLSAVRIPARTS